MIDENSTDVEPTSSQSLIERTYGYCDKDIELLALVGDRALYCSAGCLLFADDFTPKATNDAQGGETR